MSFALLIASLLSSVVQNLPQVSASIKSIVAAIFTSLNAVVASGVTTTLDPTTVLAALAGVIATLKAQTNLPAASLAIIAGLDDAIAAALAADTIAKQKVDPTQLQPITPLP